MLHRNVGVGAFGLVLGLGRLLLQGLREEVRPLVDRLLLLVRFQVRQLREFGLRPFDRELMQIRLGGVFALGVVRFEAPGYFIGGAGGFGGGVVLRLEVCQLRGKVRGAGLVVGTRLICGVSGLGLRAPGLIIVSRCAGRGRRGLRVVRGGGVRVERGEDAARGNRLVNRVHQTSFSDARSDIPYIGVQ
jgi:hypothetical protein